MGVRKRFWVCYGAWKEEKTAKLAEQLVPEDGPVGRMTQSRLQKGGAERD